MVELAPELCRHIVEQGTVVVDTATPTTRLATCCRPGWTFPDSPPAGCAARKEKPVARTGSVQELRLGWLGSSGGTAGGKLKPCSAYFNAWAN